MKKLWMVGLLVMIFGFAAIAWAFKPVTFEWTCNTEPEVVGYKIYFGGLSGTYTNHVDVGPVTPDASGKCYFTMNGPPYYAWYAATAYGSIDGDESDFSVEVEHASQFSTPGHFKKLTQ